MLRRLPALALVLLVVCLETFQLYANDVWMHLLLGRDILRDGIPHQEVYSYTSAGRSFVYHEWLAGVVFRALEVLGGPSLLLILQPLAVLAVAWLGVRTCRSLGSDPDLAVAVVGLGIYVASFRLFLRPHLLALLMLAALLCLLERYRKRGGAIRMVGILAVQVLWTNLHGSFVEGAVLAGLFALGEAIRRRWSPEEPSPAPLRVLLGLAPAMLVVSLLNPYGLNLVRLALLHPVDPMFRERIYEYFPTFGEAFRGTRIFLLFLGWIALLAAATWLGRRRLDPAHLLPRVDPVHLAFRVDGNPEIHEDLRRSPSWELVYLDDDVLIYARRRPEFLGRIDRDRLECINPIRFDREGIPPEEATCWEAEARRLLQRDPDGVLTRFLLAAALRSQGRFREAFQETEPLVTRGGTPSWVYRLRADLHTALGEPDRARQAAATAAELESLER